MEAILVFLLWLLVYALCAAVVVWIILMAIEIFFPIPPKIRQLVYAIAGLLVLIWAVTHLPVRLPG